MKRLHIHISVQNINDNIAFYTHLLSAAPVKVKPDYAKWMFDDPKLNFAISSRSNQKGLDHLGIQLDSPQALQKMHRQIEKASLKTYGKGHTTCCYAQSDKYWLNDPNGIAWETYHTLA